MKQRRVKITGIGPVTPAGVGRTHFWNGLQESISRVRELQTLNKYGNGDFVAAEVSDASFDELSHEFSLTKLPRHTQFAVVGAELAARDAGLTYR